MTVAADLLALQESDLALDSARARLSEIGDELRESDELTSARAWLEAAEENLRRLTSEQSDLEFAADEVRAKVSQVEEKLYSGTVTDARELSDLDADLKSLKNNLQTREDDLLTALEATEEGEATAAQAKSIFAGVEASWQAGQGHLEAEKAEVEPEAERLQALREEQASAINRGALSLYDTLRGRRDGAAVATVERGMCQGCRISLPRNIIQKARDPSALVQCVSCERILVFV